VTDFYLSFIEAAIRSEQQKANRDNYRLIVDCMNYSLEVMRAHSFQVDEAFATLIAANLKTLEKNYGKLP
jgi:hypothetical protein